MRTDATATIPFPPAGSLPGVWNGPAPRAGHEITLWESLSDTLPLLCEGFRQASALSPTQQRVAPGEEPPAKERFRETVSAATVWGARQLCGW